jgi:hypothetical protein
MRYEAGSWRSCYVERTALVIILLVLQTKQAAHL